MTAARIFATTGLGLTIVGAIGTVLVRFGSPVPLISSAFGFGGAAMFGYLIGGLAWSSMGALLVVRRPGNTVGWLMVLVGVGFALSQLSISLASEFAADGTSEGERLAQVAAWVTVLLQLVGVFQIGIGFLFPGGRAQSRGWARIMRIFWAFAIVFSVISLSQPGPLQLVPALQNPFGFGPDLRGDRPIAPMFIVFTLIVFVGLGASMAQRYRSAGLVERLQLKWFVMALSLTSIGLAITVSEVVYPALFGTGTGLTVFVYAGAVVPVAIAIAILRHHLFDIERIISRTISYAVVTGVLAGVFGLAVLSLGVVLGSLGEGQTIAVAGSTLLVAALFGPLRRRAQTLVDRRFDRSSFDATQTVQAMTDRLRDDVDIDRVETDVLGVVDRTFHPTEAGIWLRGASR